jgi:hypothetical protein
MLVFQGTTDGFKFISSNTITREPIQVLSESKSGWHTLAVSIGGGGMSPGQVLMRFDGKKYPLNPTMQPAATSKDLSGAMTLPLQE